ncbi:unnamed protein product [Adineta steineri]|uniref:Uncharacterized protein n=1 Tax=Adineta steineri TaxID=433720 RepID=A0A815T3K4_9BILA|nr:unnamed protein product [Adineta steineri]CAF1643558.1 unnamed protein product [Adineta steineri]
MAMNRSIENTNSSYYSSIIIPTSFLCPAFLVSVIIYIYLRKYHQNFNADEKQRHIHILQEHINYFKEINEKQQDKRILSSNLCRFHQNK